MNTESTAATEAMVHTEEELSTAGEVRVVIQYAEAEATGTEALISAEQSGTHKAETVNAQPSFELESTPDIIEWADLADKEALATLAALGTVTIIARPVKIPLASAAASIETGAAAARFELEAQQS